MTPPRKRSVQSHSRKANEKTTDSGRRFRRFLEEQSGLKHVYSLVALPRAQHLFERRRDEATAKAASNDGDAAETARLDADVANCAAGVLANLVMNRGHD